MLNSCSGVPSKAVIEVKDLLPLLTDDDNLCVGSKLNELREALDQQSRRFATASIS
jgi:hypothetical protein